MNEIMKSSSDTEIGSYTPLVAVRPMLMITGFLGAGKTTLLRALLDEMKLRALTSDVILNDRENAAIDRETVKDRAASVSGLTGSCVCCEGFGELMEMMRGMSKSEHDVLLVELNGTADPIPLLESFAAMDSTLRLRPRWQVCVIDARYFKKRRRYNALESLQLETASHYHVSWDSELNEDELKQLEGDIKAINPRASRVDTTDLVDALAQVMQKNQRFSLARQGEARPASHKLDVGFTEPKVDERHQIAHEFTSCRLLFPEAVEEDNVTTWLEKLPESVIRAKALITLSKELDRRYLYERVGQEISPNPLSVRVNKQVPCSAIFMGADLDPEEILEITQKYLHPDCRLPD